MPQGVPTSDQHYAVRVDVSDADRDNLSRWCSANGSAFLCVYEEAADENPHVHIVLFSNKNIRAIRESFRRTFPDKTGNGAYSIKVCDDDTDAYMRYMCKGKSKDDQPEVWFRQGLEYSVGAVVDAHERYWVNNEALAQNRRVRQRTGNIVEELERICKSKGVSKSDRTAIAKEYIRLYRDARKGINVFQARAVVNTVQLLLDDNGDQEEVLAGQIANY